MFLNSLVTVLLLLLIPLGRCFQVKVSYLNFSFDKKWAPLKVTEGWTKMSLSRSSHRRCSVKKVFLETSQNSQENTCARVSCLNLRKKEMMAQVFSCGFCKISKNTFFARAPQVAASYFHYVPVWVIFVIRLGTVHFIIAKTFWVHFIYVKF